MHIYNAKVGDQNNHLHVSVRSDLQNGSFEEKKLMHQFLKAIGEVSSDNYLHLIILGAIQKAESINIELKYH